MCGTHLYAAAFGSPVHRYDDSNPAAMPFLTSGVEADRVAEPDIWTAPTLYRVFELARAVQDRLGADVWLGPPDCQTGFDTACLIWDKTAILCALADPEEAAAVKRLAGKCASLFRRTMAELRREFPTLSPAHCPCHWVPPELGPWVSNDECGAVSTAMFEEFMLPELVELSQTFGSMGMHCCAAAEHQFASFATIPNFYAFNRVPAKGGPGLEAAVAAFDGPGAPVHAIGWIDPATIGRLVSQAKPGTRFVFVAYPATLDDARTWLDAARAAAGGG
jgi:hypothetical protein